ncbi:hypothetical protein KJ766_02760 [Patescibacteria group bacterium]|nr:hypothetical protein [Patescibacteria group bacterium]
MNVALKLSLSFTGNEADKKEIDLYDVSQALVGFQRSLALTTHLVINDKIITQAPSLKGAQILALPSEEGSWKMTAVIGITASTIMTAGLAPQNSVIGHLVYSAYDYIINETLGFHVDYNKSLGKQYEELQEMKTELPVLQQHRLDSLREKCEKAIKDIHRPIYAKNTASQCIIKAVFPSEEVPVGQPFNKSTYEYISYTQTEQKVSTVVGRVSSYNSNTFKGRIYVSDEGRPIPFTLMKDAKTDYCVSFVANSLHANTQRSLFSNEGFIFCKVFKNTSKSGLLKSYNIINVSPTPFE